VFFQLRQAVARDSDHINADGIQSSGVRRQFIHVSGAQRAVATAINNQHLPVKIALGFA
jgi:hypothetical protein